MEHTIGTALKRRADLIGGKAWGADKGKPRIYMDYGRKDVSAFFAFPHALVEPTDRAWDREPGLGEPELKVFIEDDEAAGPRPMGWYNDEKAKVRSAFRMKRLAIMALDCGASELAATLVSAPDVDDDLYGQLGELLASGKADEAMAAITGSDPF